MSDKNVEYCISEELSEESQRILSDELWAYYHGVYYDEPSRPKMDEKSKLARDRLDWLMATKWSRPSYSGVKNSQNCHGCLTGFYDPVCGHIKEPTDWPWNTLDVSMEDVKDAMRRQEKEAEKAEEKKA